jgi:CubicO group peptidase (beta-lactamase class C family)
MKIQTLFYPILLAIATMANSAEIPQVPPAQAGLSAAKLAEVDKFMERAVADQKMAGGIVVISHNGQIGFFHTYGHMDREAKSPWPPTRFSASTP